MKSADVIKLYDELEQLGVDAWLDGGWGVDALLGEQTRPHDDVDIIVKEEDLQRLRIFLEGKNYKDVVRDDTRDWNFVLGDDEGHTIDVHVINFDKDKNGIYGPAENGASYPALSLTGTGMIDGRSVRCLTPEYQIESHSGYMLRDKDHSDVLALCKRFNLPIPKSFD